MTRLEELEIWVENQKKIDGKRFSTKCLRYAEFDEYLTLKAQQTVQAQQTAQAQKRNDPATDSQIAYLVKLGVVVDSGLTKKRASELIDAAKHGRIGSVGGWYRDGSN